MLSVLLAIAFPLPAYVPTQKELIEGYRRGDELRNWARLHSYGLTLQPNWLGQGRAVWYRTDLANEQRIYTIVDCTTGEKKPLFDKAKLSEALTKESKQKVDPDTLSLRELVVNEEGTELTFSILGGKWKWVTTSNTLARLGDALGNVIEVKPEYPDEEDPRQVFPAPPPYVRAMAKQGQGGLRTESVDKYKFALKDGYVVITDGAGAEVLKSKEAGYSRPSWSPKGRYLVAWKLIPGDHRQVHLVVSSPSGGGRAQLRSRNYDLPGDKLDQFQMVLFDAVSKTEKLLPTDPMMGGGQPWAGSPGLDWEADGLGYVDVPDRGYQRYRLYQIDPTTATVKTIVDESYKTFFDTTSVKFEILKKSPEIIWRSERDGYGHFYLLDRNTGTVKNQITKGPWVTRDVLWVDEDKREICFTANGREEGDPYYLQAYVVNFDGTGLRPLTDGLGNHAIQFSPDRKTFIDTRSMIDLPPVHELRRTSDGTRLRILESADITEVFQKGVKWAEPFVAKGRDGKTDIYGVVCWPTNYDPKKSYPVIENIYAGPHDSFVPKTFFPYLRMQRLSELGFIVVQIDGMGTRNRGKAFHDVAWQNIADAGFPDRIAWMKALAAKNPSVDISRVGVFGTSAGGQNSTAAVLFQPEFYKVAVSSCGCHDNRMDKMWWNEQWMGYPVGPHYEKQSNITNAANLKGDLMLIVGELDTNVPPESTYRLVDALARANKDFEFVLIPGADHTDGGEYGERKRKDFFVKKLFGVDPPKWSAK